MNYLETANFNASIRDYEFTRKVRHQIFKVVNTETFEDMPSEDIFRFLYKDMSIVSFKDYLKRYLYERAGIEEPFAEVDDRMWQEIIMSSFEENNAPHSFEPTSTRWKATVSNWLNSDRVRRATVFLLGFGLRMRDDDVTDFLTKVLEEDDYHMDDPDEVIWRYCFHHDLPYAQAVRLKELEEKLQPVPLGSMTSEEILQNEDSLLCYLAGIKNLKQSEPKNNCSTVCFEELYESCKRIIVQIYNSDEEEKPEKERKQWTCADIGAADLEKMLCSGIPVNESGNLIKANKSLLNRHFQNYRPSRQRIDGILKGQAAPDRYDLITLCFFIHAQNEELSGEQRLVGFLQDINTLLTKCSMYEIHPTNPYEAFILICILSDCPLAVYGDIWEMAYENQTGG